jgi:hypothetical protein
MHSNKNFKKLVFFIFLFQLSSIILFILFYFHIYFFSFFSAIYNFMFYFFILQIHVMFCHVLFLSTSRNVMFSSIFSDVRVVLM